jgi:hypothetical protein
MVIGGFSISALDVVTFSRRIAGAKGRFFPERGNPGTWELKSRNTIRTKSLRRSKNRAFLAEMVRILQEMDCIVYSASIDKRRMHHNMGLQTTTPLQMQSLLEHFAVECQAINAIGIVVSDWSSHHLDAHASDCVATYAISNSLPIHPTLYFANSSGSHAIQASDLIAGIRRRDLEGDLAIASTATGLANLRAGPSIERQRTHKGRRYTSQIRVF